MDERLQLGERFSVSFQRTLKIPDDGRTYPLPPGLGPLPIHRVEEFADRLPSSWSRRGDFLIPLYQREALWLAFRAAAWKPNAVKIGVGRINAVSGLAWDDRLHDNPQDYVVCPDQPWLDGINAGSGRVRQFVAMPLGRGFTVEEQLSDDEAVGGLRIFVFEPKPGRFPDQPPPEPPVMTRALRLAESVPMGLGAGGEIRQKIYPDPHGLDTWEARPAHSAAILIVNSEQYHEITGHEPPPSPVSARTYTEYGLPWFELYDEERAALAAPEPLSRVETIRQLERQAGEPPSLDDVPVDVPEGSVRKIKPVDSRRPKSPPTSTP